MRASLYKDIYEQEIRDFVRSLTAEDFAMINVSHGEANPKTASGKGSFFLAKPNIKTTRSSKPPIDYTAIEMMADLQLAIERNNWKEAYQIYVQIGRLTNA